MCIYMYNFFIDVCNLCISTYTAVTNSVLMGGKERGKEADRSGGAEVPWTAEERLETKS